MALPAPSLDPLELLNRVDAFYNSAWTKLIVMFGATGVITPIIVGLVQRSEFKNLIEQHRTEFKDEIAKARTEIVQQIKVENERAQAQIRDASKQFDEKLAAELKRVDKKVARVAALGMFVQGLTFLNEENIEWALPSFVDSINVESIDITSEKEVSNTTTSLARVGACLTNSKCTAKTLAMYGTGAKLQKLLEALEQLDITDSDFETCLASVKKDFITASKRS